MDTLFILTRTSSRPHFFSYLKESIEKLTWPGKIVHIVHTDDPRDTYVTGDIIIRGESLLDVPVMYPLHPGQYNLYNNRLLDAIPEADGWVHFIDDDDEYASPDVFERMLENADHNKVIVGHVRRGRGIIPPGWGTQTSFQTEIPIMRVPIARSARWPVTTSGDHAYTGAIVKQYGCQWVDDVLIATTREGKGRGKRNDRIGTEQVDHGLLPDTEVYVKPTLDGPKWEPHFSTLQDAESEECLITFKGVTAEYVNYSAPRTPVEFDSDLQIHIDKRVSLLDHIDEKMKRSMSFKKNGKKNMEMWRKRSLRLHVTGSMDGWGQ